MEPGNTYFPARLAHKITFCIKLLILKLKVKGVKHSAKVCYKTKKQTGEKLEVNWKGW